MPDNDPDALDINATIVRLTELEAERDELVSRLRTAGAAIGEVLSCYSAEPAPKRGRPKKDAPPEAPKKRGRPKKDATVPVAEPA